MLDFIEKFILIPITFLVILLLIICSIMFVYEITNYDYQIKQDDSFYFTNNYYEKDNCIFFDNTKICGHYTIKKRK